MKSWLYSATLEGEKKKNRVRKWKQVLLTILGEEKYKKKEIDKERGKASFACYFDERNKLRER